VIVAGPMIRQAAGQAAALGDAISRLAERSGWPLIADILATCRPQATQSGDVIARRPDGLTPDAVLWFCDAPVSAPLLRWIGRCPGTVARISAGGTWRDPSFKTSLAVDAAPADTADALTLPPASAAWRERWAHEVARAESHIATADEHGRWEGPILARALAAWPGAHVHIANSSSIRDLDTFGRLGAGGRALCNRGVNGIDGTIATAAGEAMALGQPLLAVVGDLALAHDLGALLHTPATSLVILAIDNGGGQIFRQLPVREHPAFEELFVTPTPTDLGAIAGALGWSYAAVGGAQEEPGQALEKALVLAHERGRTIIQLHLDPDTAFDARRSFWSAWR
jgi:2-succinyl-5-enolpyruvyl-6-hydroxy-3-cyclohexene-1-carboxylate synthase